MAFDKTKAMRNAERYLAQGKIRAAIGEYKDVVDNDPRDYVTMNLLGDLYTKASEPKAAIMYYTTVAEHYSKQGFAQKAIAVYNKISKLQPNSMGISEKLAELYRQKGSVNEAKSHYVVLAESYQAKGRITEALAMWKQIGLLDPTNTDVYPTMARSYLGEGEVALAAEAYADAGDRYRSCSMHEDGREAYWKGIETLPSNQRCLRGFADVSFDLDDAAGAIARLQELSSGDRTLSEVQGAVVDCYIRLDDPEQAERSVMKLVEQDPTQYPKLLDLANFYIYRNEFGSACRVLTVASSHMLQGGQAELFAGAVRVILESEPEQLEALRLLVQFCTWQKDESELKDALVRLAEVARAQEAADDERLALAQLVYFMPHDSKLSGRLHELNSILGIEDEPVSPDSGSSFDNKFFRPRSEGELTAIPIDTRAVVPAEGEVVEAAVVTAAPPPDDSFSAGEGGEDREERLRKECDSIKFYIDSGYVELAEKAVVELRKDFGDRPEVDELDAMIASQRETVGSDISAAFAPVAASKENGASISGKAFDLGEFKSELGFEEFDRDDSDFETKYQTAVAYQEMGLLEQAIAEFQDAANLVSPNDGTRRFFNCANLLGHCFMANGMPKLAGKWYERALEISDLSSDEKLALWYELGVVYEAEENQEEAGRYFEQVYAENVEFRDVRERLRRMTVTS